MTTTEKVKSMRAADPMISGSAMALHLGVSRQRIAQILISLGLSTAIGRKKHPNSRQHFAEWKCWWNMIHRCTNPNSQLWKHYGGRGIKVCKRWMTSFEAFYEDMGAKPSASYSIDRVNNDGNYEPKNCRWATKKEQRANQREPAAWGKEMPKNAQSIWFNKRLSVAEKAKLIGCSPKTLYNKFGPTNAGAGRKPK